MREASTLDREYVAQCFVDISQFMKSQASDIYVDGLPDAVDEFTLELASSYIKDEDAIVLIVERKNTPVACIAARLENTSFSPSGVGDVGNILICWVAEEYRTQNIGKELVSKVESWFLHRGVNVVELSYLAQNSLAETAWGNIGYVPFRVFSHKVLKNA
jgi:GNAT superfamily N-acetyltransferase